MTIDSPGFRPGLRAAAFAMTLLAVSACAGSPSTTPAEDSKLDAALLAIAANPNGAGDVLVVVTLAPGTSAASYTPPGMTVSYRFVSTNAVAGAVPATGLAALAAAPEVQRVVPDGEMKTLEL